MGRTVIIINYEDDDNDEDEDDTVEDPTYIKCVDLLLKTNTELAAILDGVSTLVLSGGPQHIPDISSNDFERRHPDLKCEIQLIFLAAQRSITVIGICLGFQLINYAFGNPVVSLSEPIIGSGFLDVSSVQTYADPMLECIDFHALAKGFSFHYDCVPVAVSPKLRVVATGPNGIIYFVKHVKVPIYGIQSHPEATVEGIQSCLERYDAMALTEIPNEKVLRAAMATFFHAFGISNPLD